MRRSVKSTTPKNLAKLFANTPHPSHRAGSRPISSATKERAKQAYFFTSKAIKYTAMGIGGSFAFLLLLCATTKGDCSISIEKPSNRKITPLKSSSPESISIDNDLDYGLIQQLIKGGEETNRLAMLNKYELTALIDTHHLHVCVDDFEKYHGIINSDLAAQFFTSQIKRGESIAITFNRIKSINILEYSEERFKMLITEDISASCAISFTEEQLRLYYECLDGSYQYILNPKQIAELNFRKSIDIPKLAKIINDFLSKNPNDFKTIKDTLNHITLNHIGLEALDIAILGRQYRDRVDHLYKDKIIWNETTSKGCISNKHIDALLVLTEQHKMPVNTALITLAEINSDLKLDAIICGAGLDDIDAMTTAQLQVMSKIPNNSITSAELLTVDFESSVDELLLIRLLEDGYPTEQAISLWNTHKEYFSNKFAVLLAGDTPLSNLVEYKKVLLENPTARSHEMTLAPGYSR